MSVREVSRKPKRERWPVEFDLEGVPRDTHLRQGLINQQLGMDQTMPQNSFLSDKQGLTANLTPMQREQLLSELLKSAPAGKVIDLNSPVRVAPPPGGWPKYPKLMYDHKEGKVRRVEGEEEEKLALKEGFKNEASPNHDYSTLHHGVAMTKKGAQQSRQRKEAKAKLAYDSGMTLGQLEEAEAQ